GTQGFQDFADALPQRHRIERRGAVRRERIVDPLLEEVAVRTRVGRELGGDCVLHAGRQALLVVLAFASEAELGRRRRPTAPPPPGGSKTGARAGEGAALARGARGRGKEAVPPAPPH